MFIFVAMKLRRQVISVCLLVGIFANNFNYWVLSTCYAINRSYISAVLCINKSHPEVGCEGSCFMHIKLKELEQKNKNEQKHLKQLLETTDPSALTLINHLFEIDLALALASPFEHEPITSTTEVFQPPRLT